MGIVGNKHTRPIPSRGERTMSDITIDIPEESLIALKLAREAAGVELRTAAAVKFHEMGRLSSGAAAKLAGMARPRFLARLADYGAPTFQLTKEELKQEKPLA